MNLVDETNRPTEVFYEAQQHALLTKEEEIALGRAIRDNNDIDALQKLTAAHVRLALSVARKYSNIDPKDAEGQALEGLMHAAQKFDPDKGARFSTYALQWIRAKINEQLVSQSSIVKSGTTVAEKAVFFNRKFIMSTLMQTHGVEDIAQFTDAHWEEATRLINEGDTKKKHHKPRKTQFSVKEVKSALLRLHYGDCYLDALRVGDQEDGSASWVEYLEDDTEQISAVHEKNDEIDWRRGMLIEAFATLNEREQDIFSRRYLQEEPDILEDIAAEYDFSKERARQIAAMGAQKIRESLWTQCASRFGPESPEAQALNDALENDKSFKLFKP